MTAAVACQAILFHCFCLFSARRLREHLQPVDRAGTPEDIGALAVYLLGAQSGFVTGQHFVIDGGMTAKMQYA